MKNKYKSILNFSLLLIVTILVLYFSLKDNFSLIIKKILTMNPFWLIISLLMIFGYWFFKALVLHQTVSQYKKRYTFKKAFNLSMVTQFFNAVTPFSSGGQPFQVYRLKKQGLKISEATNVIITDFIVYQMALVLLGVIAIISNYFGHFFPKIPLLSRLVTLGFLINLGVIIFLIAIAFWKKFDNFVINTGIKILSKLKIVKDKQKTIENWQIEIDKFNEGSKTLLKDKKKFLLMVLSNFMALICFYLVPVTLLYSTGSYNEFNALLSIITSAYVMLIGSFVPIPGGTGGLEYGFIAFFGNFLTGSTLNALMLMWRFITYYLGMIIGAIILNTEKKGD